MLQNFLMDVLALTGANYLLRRRKKIGRLLIAASLLSLADLGMLFFAGDMGGYGLPIRFFLSIGFMFVSFGLTNPREFMENLCVSRLILFLSGGLMQWLSQSPFFPSGFGMSAIVAGIVIFLTLHWLSERKNRSGNIYPVVLYQNGKSFSVNAYWDSGNQLKDPYTGRCIHIIGRDTGSALLGERAVRLVPFSSLGEQNGLLCVSDIERMEIFDGRRKVSYDRVTVGITDSRIFEGKEYRMILHASVF